MADEQVKGTVGPKEEKKVSYLKEMLVHPASLYGLLGSLATGAVLALPYGFEVGALPVLAYATATAVAALFIPSSRTFKEKVDCRKRAERRELTRKNLMAEIYTRASAEHTYWGAYGRMRERFDSLTRTALTRGTALTLRDVERLDDATVDYLSLWLARLAIYDRQQAMDERQIRQKLASVTKQLEDADASSERRQLEKARSDLERVLERRERLAARDSALEAAMLAMVDTFDELYQGVMTNPNSGDVTRQLQEAVERMHIEEDLGSALEDDLGELLVKPRRVAAAQARARAK